MLSSLAAFKESLRRSPDKIHFHPAGDKVSSLTDITLKAMQRWWRWWHFTVLLQPNEIVLRKSWKTRRVNNGFPELASAGLAPLQISLYTRGRKWSKFTWEIF